MTTPEIILTAALTISPIVSVVIAWLAFRRNSKNDTKEEAKELGEMKSDLAYIKAGIDDLKSNDRDKDKRLDTMSEKIATLDAKIEMHLKDKNAHNYASKLVPASIGKKSIVQRSNSK